MAEPVIHIAHTGPTHILSDIQKHTDFDAAEVHLFDLDKEYYNFYKQAKRNNRIVYLNCSRWQLDQEYDLEKYQKYIIDLEPWAYVVPDVPESSKKTIANFKKWIKNYSKKIDPGCQTVGVVHGETFEEFVNCYNFMKENADRVAFSWDCSLYEDFYKENQQTYATPFEDVMSYGREELIKKLYFEDHLSQEVSHDLLGTCLPYEARIYKQYRWMEAIITSHPIISGMAGWKYKKYGDSDQVYGVPKKSVTKLSEIFDDKLLCTVNKKIIMNNIKWFRHTIRA